jgi:phage baseplate assembly protein W
MVNDILLDETGDLAVSAEGDLVVGFADNQHIADVLESTPGNWKQWPLVGVGLMHYVNAPLTPALARALEKEIRVQLEYDDAQEIEVRNIAGNLNVSAEYAI